MRARFDSVELWQGPGLPVAECLAFPRDNPQARALRDGRFARLLPTIQAIGLSRPRIRRACAAMGIIHVAGGDAADLSAADQRIARDFDARRLHIDGLASTA